MIRAIIFDMDGVLINSEHLHTKAWGEMLRKYSGATLTAAEKAKYIGRSAEYLARILVQKYRMNISAEQLIRDKTKRYLELSRHLAPNKTLKLQLARLRKDYKIAVASSGRKDVVHAILTRLGIKRLFPVIVTASHVKQAKPSPEIFLKAAKALHVKPENCVVIEDATNGVIAAKRAGMRCIALRTDFASQDFALADAVASSLHQALRVIGKWEKS